MKLHKKWKFIVAFFVLLSAIYFTHPIYLKALGYFLIVSDPPLKSDAIVVLDGDYPQDERLLHAVQLWRNGYAPRVILSAKLAEWQTVEDYPSLRHARKLKVLPEGSLLVASHAADSTKEEAQMLYRFLSDHGYNNVILVTSNYHTRRAKRIFEEQWEDTGVKVFVAAAPSAQFHPDEWWRHRADSRTFFFEFSKTLWYALAE